MSESQQPAQAAFPATGGIVRLSEIADRAHHRPRKQKVHAVRARYDAAQTTDENRRHFAAADGYDADASNNLGVRMLLRNRARYVFANNPRARGMIMTLAKHTVGVGPRLQMRLGMGTVARRLNDRIEASFRSWAKEIKLAKKLRIIRIAKVISGEIFPILTFNPKLQHDVKLDIQLVEADQVTNLSPEFPPKDVDGVFFDPFGNPDFYRILKYHPGALFRALDPLQHEDVSARFCLHYFTQDRPGQHRGIPEITPAVQLVEEGRRFRAAVLAAAETAADYAMTIESDAPAAGSDEPDFDVLPMDTVELERRMGTVLPRGFKLNQTKAEQPTTTFKEFSRELLAEVARCLEMPLSIASLDPNDANMSSAYVINQPYERAVEVERFDIDCELLDPLLDMWLSIAFDPMSNGSPLARRVPMEFPHAWFWPLIGNHGDPSKVANARDVNLKNNTTTLEKEWGRTGEDWEQGLRQRAKEKALMRELGLTEGEASPAGASPAGQPAAQPGQKPLPAHTAPAADDTTDEEDGEENANDPTLEDADE